MDIGHCRAVCRSRGMHGEAHRDHRRVLAFAHAVRARDRHVSGAAASCRGNGDCDRTGTFRRAILRQPASRTRMPWQRRKAVSAAKALIGRSGRYVGQQAVQLHGGMGMTDELAVGHYFKRLTCIDMTWGNTEHHTELFGRLLSTAIAAPGRSNSMTEHRRDPAGPLRRQHRRHDHEQSEAAERLQHEDARDDVRAAAGNRRRTTIAARSCSRAPAAICARAATSPR